MKNLILSVSALALIFALSACSKSARLPQTVTVAQTKEQSSKDVTLVLGDMLVVEMPGNMTTGFSWELLPVATDTPALVIAEGRYAAPPNNGTVGAPGKFTYALKTVHVGEQTLQFVYRRSFEGTKPPANTFTVNVVVK